MRHTDRGNPVRGWINNAVLLHKTGEAGACPNCGSKNVECLVTRKGRTSYTFYCKDCGSTDHLDGVSYQTEQRLREIGLA